MNQNHMDQEVHPEVGGLTINRMVVPPLYRKTQILLVFLSQCDQRLIRFEIRFRYFFFFLFPNFHVSFRVVRWFLFVVV